MNQIKKDQGQGLIHTKDKRNIEREAIQDLEAGVNIVAQEVETTDQTLKENMWPLMEEDLHQDQDIQDQDQDQNEDRDQNQRSDTQDKDQKREDKDQNQQREDKDQDQQRE